MCSLKSLGRHQSKTAGTRAFHPPKPKAYREHLPVETRCPNRNHLDEACTTVQRASAHIQLSVAKAGLASLLERTNDNLSVNLATFSMRVKSVRVAGDCFIWHALTGLREPEYDICNRISSTFTWTPDGEYCMASTTHAQ